MAEAKEDVLKGRKIVASIIAVLLVISFTTILFYNISLGTDRVFVQIIRFFLTATLCYFVYKGNNIARVIMGILSLIAAFLGIGGLILIFVSPIIGIASLPYFIAYVFSGYMLLFSKDVKKFLESQRNTAMANSAKNKLKEVANQ